MNKTIEFFYEISKIPRESGNEENIAKYLCEFAKKRNLFYRKDQYNNVIIKKKNNNKTPIILQAHMDMVCEKDDNIEFNFKEDSIEAVEEKGYLKAKGTTLGADNGIGIAQILNILDSNLSANVEAVFTVSEETSMIGADKIDLSILEGKQLINLDGFEKNTIIIESASFFDIILTSNYIFKHANEKDFYKINLKGLSGGHSGFDINKNRGNSSQLLGELLKELEEIELQNFIGGTKFNVIPSSAEATFTSKEKLENIQEKIDKFVKEKRKKYTNLKIELEKIKPKDTTILDKKESKNFIKSLLEFRHGIFYTNDRNEVTSSINLGVINLKEQTIKIGMRSSKKEEELKVLNYIKKYANSNKFKFTIIGSQPGFETKDTANLLTKLVKTHNKINNEKLNIKSLHITVEAGFFENKIPELEVAIISPEILNAHTTNECVSIESVKECDRWLEEILNN